MATYVDGLFIPPPFAAQYYYQNPAGLQQQPAPNMEDEILKDMIKKQM